MYCNQLLGVFMNPVQSSSSTSISLDKHGTKRKSTRDNDNEGTATKKAKTVATTLNNANSTQYSPWQKKLAPDVFAKGMSFLNPEEVGICERTCRLWKGIISSNNQHIWKTQCKLNQVAVISGPVREVLGLYVSKNVTPWNFDTDTLKLIAEYENRNDYPMGFYKQQFSDPHPPSAFGKEQWNKYFGDIGDAPRLPPRIHRILSSPCPFTPGQTVQKTHMLTLIPIRINGQLTTLQSISEHTEEVNRKYLVKDYSKIGIWINSQDRPNDQRIDDDEQLHLLKPEIVGRNYWVLMTKQLVEKTVNKPYFEQRAIVALHPHYRSSKLIESIVSIFMEYRASGMYLFKRIFRSDIEFRPIIRCDDVVVDCLDPPSECRPLVGDFYPGAYLNILSEGLDTEFENDPGEEVQSYFGIAPVRDLF